MTWFLNVFFTKEIVKSQNHHCIEWYHNIFPEIIDFFLIKKITLKITFTIILKIHKIIKIIIFYKINNLKIKKIIVKTITKLSSKVHIDVNVIFY